MIQGSFKILVPFEPVNIPPALPINLKFIIYLYYTKVEKKILILIHIKKPLSED